MLAYILVIMTMVCALGAIDIEYVTLTGCRTDLVTFR